MSSIFISKEIDRFLRSDKPEVLSICGRWGVGKTYAWQREISARRGNTLGGRKLYSYVSAFGIRSLDNLKALIFQSTESLVGANPELTWDSFAEGIYDDDSRQALLNKAYRRLFNPAKTIIGGLPVIGKLGDLISISSSNLIRNQIVCIDDIERSGQGLELHEILGFASFLKEQKKCKVILLLNEEGLGDARPIYHEYLEKVIDHALRFEPTASEVAALALGNEKIDKDLAICTTQLGITNIRVIRRLRYFLSLIENDLNNLHDDVTRQSIASISLLGWAVFEPKLAPNLSHIKGFNKSRSMLTQSDLNANNIEANNILIKYGFTHFDDFDHVILDALKSGWFDKEAFYLQAHVLDQRAKVDGLRAAIHAPWALLYDTFDDNFDDVVNSLFNTGMEFSAHMSPEEITDRVGVLSQLGEEHKASLVLEAYLKNIQNKPREFYQHYRLFNSNIDRRIKESFESNIKSMSLARDPKEVLLNVSQGWSEDDIKFLASVSVEQFCQMLKSTKAAELKLVIGNALQFQKLSNIDAGHQTIVTNMQTALQKLGSRSRLNHFRVERFLSL